MLQDTQDDLQPILNRPLTPPGDVDRLPGPSDCEALQDKDKATESQLPPTLPPLVLGYNTIDWPSPVHSAQTPGPSSYSSTHTSYLSSPSQASSLQHPDPPHLTRSLSDISVHSTHSIASNSRMKLKLGSSSKTPANFARKILSRNKPDSAELPIAGLSRDSYSEHLVSVGHEGCFFPWQTIDNALLPVARTEDDFLNATAPTTPVVWPSDANRPHGGLSFKGKGRSYSSPLPNSPFDLVARHETLLPLHARDLFDETLPRELRLQIFAAFIASYDAEHDKLEKSADWSVLKAAKNRWVGRDRAMRELAKLSRVSKTWRALVFDGQLWQDVDLRAFPRLPPAFLLRLAESLGPFIKSINLSGHTNLSPITLADVTTNLCVRSAPTVAFTYTQLTDINLQGCSALTTQSLHSLLIRSPFLRSLCVKGLQAVTNATLEVLALCQHLTSLNMSRCPNIDGEGIRALSAAVSIRGARVGLKELRLSGLSDISDTMLSALGRAAPLLEVLDLSYCHSLHNSALEAFVSCTEDDADIETVSLSARDAGRDARDMRRYRRRVTALRHLSLSNCVLLTDIACSNLAHAVPRLEFLELAGIGAELRDDGLVRLLGTTPLIRKLDLEDASEITDAVLATLTPDVQNAPPGITQLRGPPKSGHALEHLVVSYATRLTNDAFTALVRGCPRLRVLEADSTSMSGAVLREFVRLARERAMEDATLVTVDCRSIGEAVVKEVAANTRPRKGWRSWEARKLGYLDARDGEDLKVGQDECDEKRVVLKSFYNWQTVDAVRAARDRRRKANRKAQNGSLDQVSEPEEVGKLAGRIKWWSPRSSGNNTPGSDDANGGRDGCIVM
ncbi:hypothetical protein F5I97DRAFT_1808481 [Phlebopus sp. FC_14]|nr:hypothetical protein F5I97DRAFT_1808481 [Phlebopus sp. FC_14]